MEAINLTQSQLAERFRIEVQKFNDEHMRKHLRKIISPDVWGTEYTDRMANSMTPYTEIEILTITSILHLEILKEAGAKHLYTLL